MNNNEQDLYEQKYIRCMADTKTHISNVIENANLFINKFNLKYSHEALSPFGQDIIYTLMDKVAVHDASKLVDPELETFVQATEVLKGLTYGSKQYEKQIKVDMKDALNHHYVVNDHHPEHFTNGIKDMNIVNVLELLCDWTAACRRHSDGNIMKSIEYNKERFKYTSEFQALLARTVVENFNTTPEERAMAETYGWLDNDYDFTKIISYLCQDPYGLTIDDSTVCKNGIETKCDFSFRNDTINSDELKELADLDDYTIGIITNSLRNY